MPDKPENPPAFPIPEVWSGEGDASQLKRSKGQEGMSLRDYFAAKAMMGYLANSQYTALSEGAYLKVAEWSYKCAEAMLAERMKNAG